MEAISERETLQMGRLERYADLLLQVGANLQPGQPVLIEADVAHAPLVRSSPSEPGGREPLVSPTTRRRAPSQALG
jgi:Thermophilic metalloprotease (M29)